MSSCLPLPEPLDLESDSLPKNVNVLITNINLAEDVDGVQGVPVRVPEPDLERLEDHPNRVSDFFAAFSFKNKSGKIAPLDFLEDGRPVTAANSEAVSSRSSSRSGSVFTVTGMAPVTATTAPADTNNSIVGPSIERGSDLSEISLVETVETGKKKNNRKGFASRVQSTSFLNAVRFAPGRPPKVLCAGSDGKIHVYDVSTGHPLAPMIGHTDRVVCLAVSPLVTYRTSASPLEDSITTALVVSGSRDEHVRIWNLTSSTCLVCIHAAKSPIWAVDVAVGAQGDVIVVTGSGDGNLRSWNGRTGKKVASYRGHVGSVSAVRIYMFGEVPLLVSGGEDKAVRVWELLSGKLLKILQGHSAEIHSLYIERFVGLQSLGNQSTMQKVGVVDRLNGLTIISGGKDLSIKVWDYFTSSVLFELKGHSKSVQELAVVHMPKTEKSDGITVNTPLLVSCSEDGTVRFWNLLTRKLIKQKKWHSADVSGVNAVVVSNMEDKKCVLVASCGWDKSLQIHDLEEVLYGSSMLSCTPS